MSHSTKREDERSPHFRGASTSVMAGSEARAP